MQPVKKYPFRFTPPMLALCILGLALSAAAIALTSWQFAEFLQGDISSVYDWLKYMLLYLVAILLAVLVTAMLVRSRYLVTESTLVTQFGFIKTKYDLKSVYSVHLFRGMGKLTVYFDDYKTKYVNVVIREALFDDFVRTLTERNPAIAFSFSTAEEEEEIRRGKQ